MVTSEDMDDDLVLLVDGLLSQAAAIATKISLQQTTASASNKITDFANLRMDIAINLIPQKTVACRICHDEDEDSNMESPCSCSGTLKYAHRKCVQRWCNEKGDIICEICRQQFKPDYRAPPPRFHYPTTIGTHNDQFIRDDDFEFPAPSSTSMICCRIVATIFTVLLVLRHALPILMSGNGDYSLTLFTLLLVKTIGILLPVCFMFKAFTAMRRRRRRRQEPVETSDEENHELPRRWIRVL